MTVEFKDINGDVVFSQELSAKNQKEKDDDDKKRVIKDGVKTKTVTE